MKDGPWEERAQDVVADQQRRPEREDVCAERNKEGDDDNLGSAADDRRADKHEHQRYTEVGAVLGQVVRELVGDRRRGRRREQLIRSREKRAQKIGLVLPGRKDERVVLWSLL